MKVDASETSKTGGSGDMFLKTYLQPNRLDRLEMLQGAAGFNLLGHFKDCTKK